MKIPDERLKALAEEIKYEKQREKIIRKMLKDDAFFEEYWEQHRIGRHTGIAPIIRRESYDDIYDIQIPQGYYLNANPRAPVIMKGSIFCLKRKHSKCGYGYEFDIVERYFKAINFSCNSRIKYYEIMYKIATKLVKKGYKVGKYFENHNCPDDKSGMWFLGEWIRHDDERFLPLLEKVNLNKARAIVNERKREVEYEKNRKKWLKAQEESDEYRKKKAEKHTQTLKLNREQKAKQIAALELIQEMKNAKRRA